MADPEPDVVEAPRSRADFFEEAGRLGLTRDEARRLVESHTAFDADVRRELLGSTNRAAGNALTRALRTLERILRTEPALTALDEESLRDRADQPVVVRELNDTRDLTDPLAPFQFVPVPGREGGASGKKVLVYTIHDGNLIPPSVAAELGGGDLEGFVDDRDWGADLVAHSLAWALGLPGFYRVGVARNCLDFGRLPRVTQKHNTRTHAGRGAIHYPLADKLSRHAHAGLLGLYETISDGLEKAIWLTLNGDIGPARVADVLRQDEALGESAWSHDACDASGLVMLGIHTYDEAGPALERRPKVSLIYRPESLVSQGFLTPGLFDPLYPSRLAEFTADRMLIRRLGLVFEREQLPTADNHVYRLPDGSVELQSQAWLFFRYLQQEFHREQADSAPREFAELWAMLRNASSRRLETVRGMAVLHQHSPSDDAERLGRQYESIQRWAELERKPNGSHLGGTVVDRYRLSPLRPSSLAIEFRKDLVARGVPRPEAHPDYDLPQIRRLSGALAQGLREYLAEDRPAKQARWKLEVAHAHEHGSRR